MDGGELEHLLQRIDQAVGRIDAAVQDIGRDRAPDTGPNSPAALAVDNARLRTAVTEAIGQIDALLAGIAAPGTGTGG